jgi:hypothetical protein
VPAKRANPPQSHRSPGPAGALLVLLTLAGLLVACGISLHSKSKTTELFKRLTVAGDLTTGGQVTFQLAYDQPYPVSVTISCVLVTAGAPPYVAPALPVNTPARNLPPTPIVIPAPIPTPKHYLADILTQTIDANPGTAAPDEATPVPGTLDGQFTAPATPGRYGVYCYTPADVNNVIKRFFTISAR